MSRSWSGGSTTQWRKVRLRVLRRDGWACQIRMAGCLGTATHAHHVRGREVTGDDPTWIVAACAPCNIRTGDPNARPDPRPKRGTKW